MVGAAAIDVAALTCDPILATSVAAANNDAGTVDTNDIANLQLIRHYHGGRAAEFLTMARTGEES